MAESPPPELAALPKVLLLHPPPPVYLRYESEFSLLFNFFKSYESPLPLDQFLAAANSAGVSALFLCGKGPLITADGVLRLLPSLRCIVTSSAGLDHVDLAECRRRGIAVASAGDVYSDDCADCAVFLLIDVLRKISAGDRFVRSGSWRDSCEEFPPGNRLRGKKVGIIGLGSIGSRVAKRLEAFGCIISYTSRKKKQSVSYPFYPNILELAAASDVLVICCALNDATRHMIDKRVLLALGKDGIVVNIARGAIVDEKELVKALIEGQIGGAGLDVFENEPNVPKELLSMDNVVLTPHLGAYSRDSTRDIFELAKANLQAFFSNRPLLSPIVDE